MMTDFVIVALIAVSLIGIGLRFTAKQRAYRAYRQARKNWDSANGFERIDKNVAGVETA